MRTTRRSRASRSNVEFSATPGTNVTPTTTKSNTFHALRKEFHGLGQYEEMRVRSSTTKTPTQAALIPSRSVPQRSAMPSYVWRPRTTALTAIVATTTTVNGFESTILAAAFRRGTGRSVPRTSDRLVD